MTDILETNHQETLLALRASEISYRRLFEAAQDGILILDVDTGRINDVNPFLINLLGFTANEMIGKTVGELSPFKDIESNKVMLERLQKDGYVRYKDLPLETRAGRHVAVEFVSNVYQAGDKKVIQCNVRDITESRKVTQDLRESERRFSDLLQNVDLVSVMLDCEARITYCNECLLHITGWRREEVIGQNWFKVFIPPENNDINTVFAALLVNQREAWHHENEILTRSGERRLIRWSNSVLLSRAGDVIGTASIGEDVTESKKAARRVVYLNRVYAMLSGITSLIVRVRDRDKLFDAACRIAVEQGGFLMSLICIVDRPAMKIIPVASAGKNEGLLTTIKGLLSGDSASNTMLARAIREKKVVVSNNSQSDPKAMFGKKYGESGVCSMAVFPLIVADEAIGVFALYAKKVDFFQEEEMRLLTELADNISFAMDHIGNEEKLQFLAFHDPLTGLGNRARLHDRLNQAIRSARNSNFKVALIFGDIKGFRQINESMGRQVGDTLLREFAGRLSVIAPEPENLARINADCFAGIISNFTIIPELALLLDHAVGEMMSKPYLVNDQHLNISCRVGIAVFPIDGDDADTLFRNAEAALWKAKTMGGKYLFYQSEMNATVAETLLLEQKLRTAIEKEEFILHYQPKINTIDGKLSGLEALIRWNDPDHGLVPPLKFIPLMEESGMILEVGAWAIRRALADHRDWTNNGLQPPRIAVNVSAIQLHQKDFVNMVRDILGNQDDAIHGLDLEITESVIMENIEESTQKLTSLREMGINIAIDDFGTGYSSLGYLTRLAIDTIKIDHSFVMKMTEDADSMTIVSAIISLAHALNLKVVAEGVATEEHARFLKLLNCDELQGYFYSEPLPPQGIINLLKAIREKADFAKGNPVPILVA